MLWTRRSHVGILGHPELLPMQVLRVKGVVSILLLARHSTRWIAQACDNKFFTALDKLQREQSEPMQEALHAVKHEIGNVVPVMLAQVMPCRGSAFELAGIVCISEQHRPFGLVLLKAQHNGLQMRCP